jgi:hypothetical protein
MGNPPDYVYERGSFHKFKFLQTLKVLKPMLCGYANENAVLVIFATFRIAQTRLGARYCLS